MKEKFLIPYDYDGRLKLVTVEGDRITLSKVPCFIFKDNGLWNVTHLETGMKIKKGYTKKTLITVCKKIIKEKPEAFEEGRNTCKKLGIKLPVNI